MDKCSRRVRRVNQSWFEAALTKPIDGPGKAFELLVGEVVPILILGRGQMRHQSIDVDVPKPL